MSFAELAQEMSGEDGEDGEEVKGGNQGDGEEEISQQRSTPTGKTLTPSPSLKSLNSQIPLSRGDALSAVLTASTQVTGRS